MQGQIYLIPNLIGDTDADKVLTTSLFEVLNNTKYFIVEDIRNARRFLKKIKKEINIDELIFFTLNKHTDNNEINEYLKPVFDGNNIGIISEAGTPCIADPGNIIVKQAHYFNIKVVPIVGPSSIIMALMASGLNGQNFAFNGYLPIQDKDRKNKIKLLELRSEKENQSQIFMETPYRNNKLLDDLLNTCKKNTMLCIASNITVENEFIKTMRIDEWRNNKPDLNKKPSIFIIHAE